jgi:glycosyltransferase involved in cell wall biosynthesis
MIRVLTWPDVRTAINPCLRLFYRALEPWQVVVAGRIPLDNAALRRLAPEVDVLHFHWGPDALWRNRGGGYLRRLHGLIGFARLLGLARELGKKIVWTIHDLESHDGSDFLDRRGYRLLASRSDLCICHDEYAYRESIRRLGCRPERLLVTPLGHNGGALPPPAGRDATLSALGLDPARPTLLCFGLVRPYKGFDVALDALRRLPPDYQLLIAGAVLDPGHGELLREKASGDSRVRLVLRELSDQELADYLHACDCVLLPYRRITGSGALLTASAAGRGVVASDLPWFRATLAAEPDAGTLCRTGDAADLAAAVGRYLSVPADAREAAARRLADRHSWEEVVRAPGEWLQRTLPERLEAPARPLPAASSSGRL